MNFRTTIRLFLAVCFLGMVIWVFEWRSDSADRKHTLQCTLFEADANDIKELIVERDDLHFNCVKKEGRWWIETPLMAAADGGQIDRLLGVIEEVAKEEIITPAQRKSRGLTLKDYGLMEPRARIVINTGLFKKDLILGYDAPLGRLMYVMFAGGNDVIGVNRSLYNILPDKIEDLRDRKIFYGDRARISRLEIQREGVGFIQMAQVDGKWMMRQPVSCQADGARILQMLDALFALRISSFIWDPIIKPVPESNQTVEIAVDTVTRLEPYRLSQSESGLRIALWTAGDDMGKELIIGKDVEGNSGEVYAKTRGGDSIYSVSNNIRDIFSISVDDLRSKNIFPASKEKINFVCFKKQDKKLVLVRDPNAGWSISDPVQWRADGGLIDNTIQQIVSLNVLSFQGVSRTNLAEYGLMPENFSILLSIKSPPVTATGAGVSDGANETVAALEVGLKAGGRWLLVGNIDSDKKTAYVKFSDSDEVFVVPSEPMQSMSAGLIDPLVYKDRTMLAVSPDKIKRISLSKSGAEQIVSRQDDGSWTIAGASRTNEVNVSIEKKINDVAIGDVMFQVSNMRAARIEQHNPQSLVEYGLDKPIEMLTVGLSGDEGIQKSIMLGFVAGTDGRYAMVQGQDVVFVLDKNTVNQLTQDIVRQNIKRETDEKGQ